MTWFKVDDKLHGHPQRAAGREMGQLDLIELPRGPHHVGTDDTVRVGHERRERRARDRVGVVSSERDAFAHEVTPVAEIGVGDRPGDHAGTVG